MRYVKIILNDNQVFRIDADTPDWLKAIRDGVHERGLRYPGSIRHMEIEDTEHPPEPTPEPPVRGCCG